MLRLSPQSNLALPPHLSKTRPTAPHKLRVLARILDDTNAVERIRRRVEQTEQLGVRLGLTLYNLWMKLD